MAGRVGRGADDWVERVRAASDIVEIIGQTVHLKRVGRNWVGLCPFHQEKTPSFSVNAERQFYHCFSCKVGGDVFKFVQESEKVGFIEAAELLSRRAGVPVPERRTPGDRGARAALLDALEQAATAYEQWLADPERGAEGRALLERRGIRRETARAFRLGLAPDGWELLSQRLRERFGEELLIGAGLAAGREGGRGVYDRFRHRLIVPLVTPGGQVVGFGARSLGDDNPKYLNSPETPVYHKGAFLFALDQARKHPAAESELVVVEGYFDAMALHQAGIGNTVATSGTALTAEQARLLRRVSPRVALTYDGDAAGQQAMMRSLGVLLAEGLEVVMVDLPAGDDPDTLVRRGGTEAWNEIRRAAYDPVEFVQRHLLRTHGREAAGDPRERALQAVVQLAAGVDDTIRRRLLLERASAVFGLAETVLERATVLRRSGQRAEAPIAAVVRAERRGERSVEQTLLQALIHASEEALETARAQLSPEDFMDPACAALAGWLWRGEPGLPEDGAAGPLARELASTGLEDTDWNAEALGGIRKLTERRLKRQLQERKQQLRHAAGESDSARLKQEILEIARSLRELSA